MSKYISKYAPHQTLKIPNLEQYAPIFPKGTGTGPIPKRVRKIPESFCWFCHESAHLGYVSYIITHFLSLIQLSKVLKGWRTEPFNRSSVHYHNDPKFSDRQVDNVDPDQTTP